MQMLRREWTTPTVIGCFIIMSITGILMFFRLDQGMNKVFHQWVSWAFVVGVFVHVVSNWSTFPRYFTTERLGRALIILAVIILAGSFYSWGSGKDEPPSVLAMRVIVDAPISKVAGLLGKDPALIIKNMNAAGIALHNESASIDSAARGNRKIQGKAIKILLGSNDVR